MVYSHAVLGETPELFQDTAEWAAAEVKKIERNERAKKQVLESIQPLLDLKRKKLIGLYE